MSKSNHYKAAVFIAAIPGTGGIISAIARKVGCSWNTAQKYIQTYPTIKRAYDDECESIADVAESVLYRNIRLAYKKQSEENEQVDSSDAKWYLSRKAKGRGYTEKRETEHSGPGGTKLTVEVTGNVKPDKL